MDDPVVVEEQAETPPEAPSTRRTTTYDFPDVTIESSTPRELVEAACPEIVLEATEYEPLATTDVPPIVIAFGGATAATLLGTAIFGILALDAEREFELGASAVADAEDEETRNRARSDALDASARADAFAIVSDVLLGVSVLGAGATVFFALDSDVRPVVTPTSVGATARATF